MAPCVRARGLRRNAPLRHCGGGNDGHVEGVHDVPICAPFTRRGISPANATLIVVGDVRPDDGAAAAGEALRHVDRQGDAVARTPIPAAPQLAERRSSIVDVPGAEQSQVRIGWVGVRALDAGLLHAAGAQHDPRRLVHVAAEPEPARGSRLHLRRQLAIRHAPVAGAVCRRRGRADRQDRRSRSREFFNELERDRQADWRRRADQGARTTSRSASRASSRRSSDLSVALEEMVVYKLPDDYFNALRRQYPGGHAPSAVPRRPPPTFSRGKFAVVVVGDRKVIEAGVRGAEAGAGAS